MIQQAEQITKSFKDILKHLGSNVKFVHVVKKEDKTIDRSEDGYIILEAKIEMGKVEEKVRDNLKG